MAAQQLMQDDAGNVWDMSSGKPVLVKPAQGSASPNVVIPAPPPKREFVPNHPNLMVDPSTGEPIHVPGVPSTDKTTWRTMTPQEVRASGRDPRKIYQVSSEGEVKESGAAASETSQSKQQAMEASRALLQSIEKARGYIYDSTGPLGNTATGLGFKMLHNSPIPTNASQLDATIEGEIKGKIFQSWMNSMKAATADEGGSAFGGRILANEIPFIVNAQGALSPGKLHTNTLLGNLDQIEQRVLRSAALLDGQNPDNPETFAKYQQMLIPRTGNLQSVNDEMRRMFHNGASAHDIVAYGIANGVTPNPDQIELARHKGMDVNFVQPDPNGGAGNPPPSPSGGGSPPSGSYADSYLSQGLSGANEGLAGVLGAPVDLMTGAVNLVPKGINAVANTNIPTITDPFAGGQWWKNRLTDTGSILPSSGDPSKQFTRRVGESVGAAAVPGMFGGSPLKVGAALLAGAGGGIGGATAQRLFPGNPLAELAGEIVGNGLTGLGLLKGVQRSAQRQIEAGIPTVEDLKGEASALYRKAETRGVVATPEQTQRLATDVHGILRDEGHIGPSGSITAADTNTSKAFNLIHQYAGKEMTPKQMNTVRTVLADSRKSADPADRRLGSILLDHFDNWVSPMAPEFDQARSVASRYLQTQDLERARELAGARASQFTGSGFENALRTEYRGLDRGNIKGQNYFAPDVTDAIQNVARGTPVRNALRGLGRLAPTGPVSMLGDLGAGAGMGMMAGSPVTGGMFGGGMAGLGVLGRVGATRMGIRAADKAELIARNGGALEQAPILSPDYQPFAAWLAAVQQAKYLNGQ